MIKNILYLDEQKLISLSSQVMEGITDYLIKSIGNDKEESISQKGPVASGRILAEAIKSNHLSIERKTLHDHAFSNFEKYLIDHDLLINITTDTETENLQPLLQSKSFIKIHATAKIIDPEIINSLISRFNEIGAAVAYVTNHSEINNTIEIVEKLVKETKLASKKSALSNQLKELKDDSFLAKNMGMWQEPKFLKSLGIINEFGFKNQLEIQQKIHGLLFSSLLKDEFLRERKDLIIRKYSRITERTMVILGVITQTNSPQPINQKMDKVETMKDGLVNLVDHITDMEMGLFGKSPNEIIIDPIAIYVAL